LFFFLFFFFGTRKALPNCIVLVVLQTWISSSAGMGAP
jgi:hypothetical protein